MKLMRRFLNIITISGILSVGGLIQGGGNFVLHGSTILAIQNFSGAEDWFTEATSLYKQGSYAAARILLQRYLNTSSKGRNYEEAQYMWAASGYYLKDPNRVILLQKFQKKYPNSRYRHEICGLLGSSYYFGGEYQKAIDAFENCKWKALTQVQAQDFLFLRSLSLLELKRLDEAEAGFEEVQAYQPCYYAPDCIYYLAYLSYQKGNLLEAQKSFLTLLNNEMYSDWSAVYSGDVYLKQKNYTEAISLADKALKGLLNKKITPEASLELTRIKGEAFFHLQRYQEAVEALTAYHSTAKNPSREAVYALGTSCLMSGAYSSAAETLLPVGTPEDDALAQNALLQMGRAYLKADEHVKATEVFLRASVLSYDLAAKEEASYNYALCIYQSPNSSFQQRSTAFQGFLNEFPQSVYKQKATAYLSEIYLSSNQYGAALKGLDAIKEPDANLLLTKKKLLFQLGIAALKTNRLKDVEGYFNRVMQSTDNLTLSEVDRSRFEAETRKIQTQSLYWRGETYYRLNRTVEAQRDIEKYLAATFDKTEETYSLAYYTLAYLSFNGKRYAHASDLFTHYLELNKALVPKGDTASYVMRGDAECRLADCYYHQRNFGQAKTFYELAAQTDVSVGDYALYQCAYMEGIEKNYAEKIRLLDQLLARYPNSLRIADALYEKGRALVMQAQPSLAVKAFDQLLAQCPTTKAARKGATERALLLYQLGHKEEALSAFQKVIKEYPNTLEAEQSLKDIKSVYVEENRVNDYVAFSATLPDSIKPTEAELDTLTYTAVEHLVSTKGSQPAQMVEALKDYISKYPNGVYVSSARGLLLQPAYEAKDRATIKELAHLVPPLIGENAAKSLFYEAELTYQANEDKEAEALLQAVIEKGTDYPYWTARCFLLLSDVYIGQGRKDDARVYLNALKENYKQIDDGILLMIQKRLKSVN